MTLVVDSVKEKVDYSLQELTQDKMALQKKVHDQMNHISQLKSQVEDLKLSAEQKYQTEHSQELQNLLQEEREALESKEKEVSDTETVPLFSFSKTCWICNKLTKKVKT